ncbi:MAG: cytochrome c, class [Polaromonas sp.]|nr:cytochrome c, class [Polaromonas sp.]
MSANDHTTAHEEAHTGPIKTPQQLLAAVFFSFVVPVFAIIGLVYYVASADKPMAGADESERAVATRIQKIGMVEIRDANRPLSSGEQVFKAQCVACHGTGAAGAPKFGDAGAWAARIGTGYDALLNSALKGKGAMAPQGGGEFQDIEIGRAVVYMANASGGKLAEPAVPAANAAAAPAADAASAAAAPATPAAPATVVAAATPATPAVAVAPAAAAAAGGAVDLAAGEALYKQACFACHGAGVAGAPKFGDKAVWAPRIQTGLDALTASVIKGKGAMPPKGGSAASDAAIHSAVAYMVNAAK